MLDLRARRSTFGRNVLIVLNLDLAQAVAIRLEDLCWDASPAVGVARKKLERQAAESGRATSLVRYAQHSRFAPHVHGGGEEFLVLAGVFSDEMGHYRQGTYVRNPVGSRHAPYSTDGCTIFVKLCQLSSSETERTVIDINAVSFETTATSARRATLFDDGRERVSVVDVPGATKLPIAGAELLVIRGAVEFSGANYPALSWIRVPAAHDHIVVCTENTRLWMKSWLA